MELIGISDSCDFDGKKWTFLFKNEYHPGDRKYAILPFYEFEALKECITELHDYKRQLQERITELEANDQYSVSIYTSAEKMAILQRRHNESISKIVEAMAMGFNDLLSNKDLK